MASMYSGPRAPGDAHPRAVARSVRSNYVGIGRRVGGVMAGPAELALTLWLTAVLVAFRGMVVVEMEGETMTIKGRHD